ncbi:unnamed protein product [Allacma fusca]|uniref:Cytochrome P450 n=1 Tax=Allacma fusca TaxID=39272 RepID=A0A8J2PMS5_9HEXA|nr:unnamed protein product [Allacma fusca]
MIATEILVLIITVLVFGYYFSTKKPKNFPPGPRPWPLFGNLFQLKQNQLRHEQFDALGKKYGDIVGLYFGSKAMVILNNPKHIKEAFAEHVFSGRDISNLIKDRNLGGNRGVLLCDGPAWQEQRRFALKSLRDFGFGKKSMEAIIMEEVNELIAGFKSQHGTPVTTQNRFNIAVLNGLWAIMTGERYSHDDPRLNHLIRGLTATIAKRPLSSVLADLFPIVYHMRKTFPSLFTITGGVFQKETYKLIGETIKSHQETVQEDSPRDFLDVYLNEVKKTKDPQSSFHGEDGILSLRVTMLDLFVAGAETTSTTLSWAFLILALHPEIQEKVHEEIKKVVGLSRHVSLTDRPDLPYLEATDMEVLRYSSLVSTGQLKVVPVEGEVKPTLAPRTLSSIVLMPTEHKLVILDRQVA